MKQKNDEMEEPPSEDSLMAEMCLATEHQSSVLEVDPMDTYQSPSSREMRSFIRDVFFVHAIRPSN